MRWPCPWPTIGFCLSRKNGITPPTNHQADKKQTEMVACRPFELDDPLMNVDATVASGTGHAFERHWLVPSNIQLWPAAHAGSPASTSPWIGSRCGCLPARDLFLCALFIAKNVKERNQKFRGCHGSHSSRLSSAKIQRSGCSITISSSIASPKPSRNRVTPSSRASSVSGRCISNAIKVYRP